MKRKLLMLSSLLLLIFLTACIKKPNTIESKQDVGRVYYEIFVRSFADSNGDGVGDINGVTKKLDYLSDLGVKGIWLMPIFPSPSYHGYDVTDYENVNPDYGTVKDLENLVKEAHKRDIKVILDFVINHTSTKHPWFNSAKDPNNKYRDYYRFKTKSDPKTGPWYSNSINGGNGNDFYYAYFWDQMPDLNYDHKEVLQQVVKSAKFWLDKGIDGFRFDAALHIFTQDELYNINKPLLTANVDFWKVYRSDLRKVKSNVYMVGEVWTSESTVAAFYEGLDSNFNFDLADLMIKTAKGRGNLYYSKQIESMYTQILSHTEKLIDAPFLRNHDQPRLMTELNNDMKLAKLTAEMLLTVQGNPFIYYGEEIGMKGNKPDEDIRSPFIWSANKSDLDTTWRRQSVNYNADTVPLDDQLTDSNSLYNHYKTLIHLRNSNKALSNGDFKYVKSTVSNIQMFMRIAKDQKQALLVVHNFSPDEYTFDLDTTNFKTIYQSKENEGKDIKTFAGKSTKIFEVPFEKYESYLPA